MRRSVAGVRRRPVIEKDLLATPIGNWKIPHVSADGRGSFYDRSEASARGRKKRSPGDALGGECAVAVEWIADQTSADVFDVAWAREVIAETLRRMQAECEAAGRDDIWRVFRAPFGSIRCLKGATADGL